MTCHNRQVMQRLSKFYEITIMLIDVLIPAELKKQHQSLYKARIIFFIIALYSLLLLIVGAWMASSHEISEAGKMLGIAILAFMIAGYTSAAALCHFRSALKLASNLLILTTFSGITCGILLSGGPLAAPATAMNIIPILMAFILINKRAGLIWTQLILATHIGLMMAYSYGYSFTQLLIPNLLPHQHLASWLITYSALILLMLIFDSLDSKLKSERDAERNHLEHLASHDPLTRLANRLQFDINLNKSMNRGDRHQKMTALFYIDLDQFKPINDNYGHDAGDIVLQEISRRLEACVRNVDTVARLGGDEFGIILEDISDISKLQAIAEKVIYCVEKPIKQLAQQPSISASIGIAIYPLHTNNKIELIQFADLAMYASKQEKNRWTLFDERLIAPTS